MRTSVRRRGLERLDDDLLDPLVRHRARFARPRLVDQAIQPIARKPPAPLAHRRHRHMQPTRQLGVVLTRSAPQHDPTAQRQRLSRLTPLSPRIKLRELPVRQRDFDRLWSPCVHTRRLSQTLNELKTQDTRYTPNTCSLAQNSCSQAIFGTYHAKSAAELGSCTSST